MQLYHASIKKFHMDFLEITIQVLLSVEDTAENPCIHQSLLK